MDRLAPNVSPPAHLPERIGRYRLLGELGRGGMGVVYRAEDERLGRPVALKLLPPTRSRDEVATRRLLQEARAAGAIDHPNVCTVYEVGEATDGRPYIALACYDGETLAARLERGPLGAEAAVRVARGVASGVAAAHARGIVHRDLKPSNVFLCADGTAKVLDFGIARVPGVALTRTGHTAGTAEYGAPEQARGHADARSDVWALGVVLYEMLTGRRPFAAPYDAAVLYAVLHEDPPPPSTVADVPAALDAVVARCLAKDPGARYPDAAALADALGGVLSPVEPARRPRPGRAAPDRGPLGLSALGRRLRQRPAWAGLAAVVAVGAVGAALWAGQSDATTGLPDDVHLAVLAPAPRPDAPDDQAFAEGLAETLASGVAQMAPAGRDFWVAPVSDVLALGVTSARAAGEVLGVNLALTGGLVREGGEVTLVLNLTTAGERARTLASRTITVPAAHEGQLRGRALAAIADMLGLGPPARVAHTTDDPEAERFFLAGVGYLERNRDAEDLDRAVDLFEQAIGEDPAYVAAHARLGEALLAKYQATRDPAWVARAQAAAERAQALDGDAPDVHVTLSRLALATGQAGLAMRHARQAVAADSLSLGAARALAEAQEAASDLEGAEATLQRLVRRHPSAWTGPFALGTFYLRHPTLGDAGAQFERVVALAPGNFQGHSGLGAVRYGEEDWGRARAAYERVVALRPDFASGYHNLATISLATGDAEGAARRYRQLLALDSTNHRTWRNLASAYWELGDRGRWTAAMRGALRQAERDLAVNPNDAALLADAATYREGTGDAAGARGDALRAVELAPADPAVQYDAGRVFALLGDLDRAFDALQAAADGGHSFEGAEDDPALAPLANHPRFPRPPAVGD